MPLPRSLELEMSHAVLVRRIVRAALWHDTPRLDRAVADAIDVHGAEGAQRDVFVPARRVAAAFSPRCHAAVTAAIQSHERHTLADSA